MEFSGKGTLAITLTSASGPAAPAKYNQPGVQYMRGHATLVITTPDATTNVSCFSVGRANAVNQSLFLDNVTYDGVADIAVLQISADSANPGGFSTFGGIRMGNTQFYALSGWIGVQAERVNVQGPVVIGDVTAYDKADPFLLFGVASQFTTLTVAGGDLFQPNGRPIQIDGFSSITFTAGTRSDGTTLPAQTNRARFVRNGVDVTDQFAP